MDRGEWFSPVRRIVVVRALRGLGDFLCIVPALRSLRTAFPEAKIVLLGLVATRPLIQRFQQYVDELLEFPGYPGLPEQVPSCSQFPAFLTLAQQWQFDLALQMQGSGTITNPLTLLLGARSNAGYYLLGEYCPDRARFLPYISQESEVRRYLRLLEFLGIPTQEEALEFPLQVTDFQALYSLQQQYDFEPKPRACLHPGASVPERRWPPEQFAAIGDALVDRGFQVIITGSRQERALAETVALTMRSPALNLAGCTSLGALAVLLKQSHLLVCNDTGVSHLADALQVPSLVLFQGSDPTRWAPLDRWRHPIVVTSPATTSAIVLAQVDLLLERSGRPLPVRSDVPLASTGEAIG